MAKDWMVIQRDDGKWGIIRYGEERTTSLHPTRASAVRAARKKIDDQGDGELAVFDESSDLTQKVMHIRRKIFLSRRP